MDDPKPPPHYDNYKQFSQGELLPEPNIRWVGVDELVYVRPKPWENILRAILNWKVASKDGLSNILGYSYRTVVEAIAYLLERKLIFEIGHLYGALKTTLPGLYYEKGDNNLRERPPVWVAPKKKSWKDPSLEDEKINRNTDKNSYFSEGRVLSRHVHMVFESVFWYMERLNDQGFAAIAYQESALRYQLGWYSEKTEKHQRDKFFLTEVPDAWIILDGGGIRVEVQLSADGKDEVKRRCEAAPHGEVVLYIVDRKDLYDRYYPMQKDIPNLLVARFRNEDSFRETFLRYCEMVMTKRILSWPLRNHYCKRGFAYCLVNPIEPNYSGNRNAFVRKVLDLKEDEIDLQRQIYQPGQPLP